MRSKSLLVLTVWFMLSAVAIACVGCAAEGSFEGKTDGSIQIDSPWSDGAESRPS